MAEYKKVCAICGKEYIALRPHGKYCCEACRLAAVRKSVQGSYVRYKHKDYIKHKEYYIKNKVRLRQEGRRRYREAHPRYIYCPICGEILRNPAKKYHVECLIREWRNSAGDEHKRLGRLLCNRGISLMELKRGTYED